MSNQVDGQYLSLIKRILDDGEMMDTRNGKRLVVWGHQLRFHLQDGFPILTTKQVWWKGVVSELKWFLSGDTDVRTLQKQGVHIWDKNALEDGTIGPGYGYQWRNWDGSGIDQIKKLSWDLKHIPTSTRMVVMAWNPRVLREVSLPPCHFAFQAHSNGTNLALQVSMRSSDAALGLPFNIASYALLTHILGKMTNLRPTQLIMDLGNIHLYEPHIHPIQQQLNRKPYPLPGLSLGVEDGCSLEEILAMPLSRFQLSNYQHHSTIDMPLIA